MRKLFRLPAIACVVGAVVIAVLLIRRPDDAAGPCVVVQRATALPEVPEASGLAISRRNPGIIWSHNDSGHAAVLFALDATTGAGRGRVRVPVQTRDWEAVAAAPCPAGNCLYIADIGDNSFARRRIQIYRVPEPAPGDMETSRPEVFSAAYADGRHNAEALFLVRDSLFVVTRDRTGGLYRTTVPERGGEELTLQRIGQLGLQAVTDAGASPDEASIVVRTSHEAIIYRTADVLRGGTVPYGLRIPIGRVKEPQGEGVALDDRGALYLASERSLWSSAGRFIRLQCTLS
jgi:hypothetical protein